jgi:hypothetical protein
MEDNFFKVKTHGHPQSCGIKMDLEKAYYFLEDIQKQHDEYLNSLAPYIEDKVEKELHNKQINEVWIS